MGEIPDVSSHLDIFPYEKVDIFAMKPPHNIHDDVILACTIYLHCTKQGTFDFFKHLTSWDRPQK